MKEAEIHTTHICTLETTHVCIIETFKNKFYFIICFLKVLSVKNIKLKLTKHEISSYKMIEQVSIYYIICLKLDIFCMLWSCFIFYYLCRQIVVSHFSQYFQFILYKLLSAFRHIYFSLVRCCRFNSMQITL